jgi:hypothetical protein
MPGMVASSSSCAPHKSSRVRNPLWTKARAEALRLMVRDKLRSLETDAALSANYVTAEWPIRDIA